MPVLCFLIALFGGIYYYCKYIFEKAQSAACDKTLNTQKQLRDQLKARLCVSFEEERRIKDYILSGKNFEKICDDFQSDFKFVFGANWKEVLRIPPRPPVLDPKTYRHDAYSFEVPANHIYWVYRLMLASRGKVDTWMIFDGYMVSPPDKNMNFRFAQCIEKRLIKAGVNDVCFVLEQCPLGNTIKFNKTLCTYPYFKI